MQHTIHYYTIPMPTLHRSSAYLCLLIGLMLHVNLLGSVANETQRPFHNMKNNCDMKRSYFGSHPGFRFKQISLKISQLEKFRITLNPLLIPNFLTDKILEFVNRPKTFENRVKNINENGYFKRDFVKSFSKKPLLKRCS